MRRRHRPPRRTRLSDVAARAAGYGIPGIVVDGNDIFAVYQAASRAVERARSGGGPTLIECKTYRWRGHTERTRAARSPRQGGGRGVEAEGSDRAARAAAAGTRATSTMPGCRPSSATIMGALEAAVAFAEASPFPLPEQATDDVFAA